MFSSIFLMGGLGCFWFGRASLTQYRRSPSQEPSLLGESILAYLGSGVNLIAAAVSFFG